MENTTLFLLISIVLALIIGFWAARKLRAPIRASAIKLIPLKKRFSEDGFNIQGRYSTILVFVFAILVSLTTWLVIYKVAGFVGQPLFKITETQEISSLNTIPDFFDAPKPKKEKERPSIDPVIESANDNKKDDISEENIPPTYEEHQTKGKYYLQLYAFEKEVRAWRQKSVWEKKLEKLVLVGHVSGGKGPYKVLVGPFTKRHQAIQFKAEYQLIGFPREAKAIRLYEP